MQKVHFLTPSYDGSCHIFTAWSVVLEILILDRLGIEATWDFHPGCCYPDIARSMLAKTFLDKGFTDCIFIDSDVQCYPGSSYKLLRHDKDIVAGIYPYKSDKEGYPVYYKQNGDGRPIVDPETGLIAGKNLPTGFLRIKRSVFEKMIIEMGDDLMVEDHKDPKNPICYHLFFDTPKIGKMKWGEDFHFSNVCEDLGIEQWIEPDIDFYHHGFKGFKGNLHDYLRKLPGGGGPPEPGWKFKPRT